jgi:hypothetical protein
MIILHNDLPPYRRALFNWWIDEYKGSVWLPKNYEKFRAWSRPVSSDYKPVIYSLLGFYFVRPRELMELMKVKRVISILAPRFLLLNIFLFLFFPGKIFLVAGFNSNISNERLSLRFFVFYYIWYRFFYLRKSIKFLNYHGSNNKRNFSTIQLTELPKSKLRIELSLIKSAVFIAYVRPRLDKGLKTIIHLVQEHPDVIFHICSNVTLDYPNVRNHGLVNEYSRDEIISKVDLVIVPSVDRDPWNWTVLEALRLSKPALVTSQVGSHFLLPKVLVARSNTLSFVKQFTILKYTNFSWEVDLKVVDLDYNLMRLKLFID